MQLLSEAGTPTRFLEELTGAAPPWVREQPAPRAERVTVDHFATADATLVEALKAWRRDRAKADGVPAYVVLHDAHLGTIAARTPKTLGELARCPGIGPTKLERYGDEIVAVVAEIAS